MPLVPVKKRKTPACIREIQVHKLWTKVYSQQGLTAMVFLTTLFNVHLRSSSSPAPYPLVCVFFLLFFFLFLCCCHFDLSIFFLHLCVSLLFSLCVWKVKVIQANFLLWHPKVPLDVSAFSFSVWVFPYCCCCCCCFSSVWKSLWLVHWCV